MANLSIGAWIRRHPEMICTVCMKSGEWPPGELTGDGVWEIRSCPNEKCDGTWKTHAMYVARPGEATEPNAFD
ncbi:hypothetical protein OG520_43870 (plasmid) [Streptomyces sp. NBC_00984]|uniref:hypothetical protein n=1 Tax=Streptomyces sp. NBC_00984 TaxID=2903700 RepID=UPI002F906835|nr:hypothetical protein OG520_43870 [Streptomyces sp. NBC_00984]